MHAISHDSQVHQKGCIYAQLEPAEEPAAWAGVQQQQNGAHGSEEEDEEEDEEESTPEIRLVPQDESVCEWAECEAVRWPQAPWVMLSRLLDASVLVVVFAAAAVKQPHTAPAVDKRR